MKKINKLLSSHTRRCNPIKTRNYQNSTNFYFDNTKVCWLFTSFSGFLSKVEIVHPLSSFVFPEISNYYPVKDNHSEITYQNYQDPEQKIIFRVNAWNSEQETKRIDYSGKTNFGINKNNSVNQILLDSSNPVTILSYRYYLPNSSIFSVISEFSYKNKIFDLEILNQRSQLSIVPNEFTDQSIRIIKNFIELNQNSNQEFLEFKSKFY